MMQQHAPQRRGMPLLMDPGAAAVSQRG